MLPAPVGAEGCAFAFVYSGTNVDQHSTQRARQWSVLEVGTEDLPWPKEAHRRNSRVLKLLPHLFFPSPVATSVYLDSDNALATNVNVSDVVRSMLTHCGAGFAAQAHKTRSVNVMQEFRAIRDSQNTVEPDAVAAQERQYRSDRRYMAALKEHGGVGIDGVLLVRRTVRSPQPAQSPSAMAHDAPRFPFGRTTALHGCCPRHGCALTCAGATVTSLPSHTPSRRR